MILAGRTVVVTRPSAGTLARRLADAWATVEHIPLIAIGPPADNGIALRRALDQLAEFDWLVVTSANGAAAVGDAAAHAPRVRLAAVGRTTAVELESRAKRPVDLVPGEANSAGLLAAFPPSPGRVLLAQADRAGERLATGLRDAGHEVVAVEAYATRPLAPNSEQLVVLGAADAVILASGSAAKAWSAAIPSGGWTGVSAAVVTIGTRTAEVAAAHGLHVAAVATAPTDEAVVAAVVHALAVR